MKCAMLDLLACTRGSHEATTKIFVYIHKQITARGSTSPPMYVKWIELMMMEGTALFRLYTILVHSLFDEEFKHRLFTGECDDNVIAFNEKLQDKLYVAFLGRKSNGSIYTASEMRQARFQRVAEIVCSMQDYYLSM